MLSTTYGPSVIARADKDRRSSFLQRLVGALALDATIYEEVEADTGATMQACAVVVLSSLAAGVGASGFGGASLAHIGLFSVLALLTWASWALLVYQIGARLLPEPETRVDVGELLRTTGFAATPGLLQVFGIIPEVAMPAFVIASIWMLFAMVVGVRQALDYTSTARAVTVCVLGWALAFAMAVVLGLFLSPPVS